MTVDTIGLAPRMLIGGDWVVDHATTEDRDPATGEILGLIPQAGPELVTAAAEQAAGARAAWWSLAPSARASYLVDAADRLTADLDGWASLMAREMGKPLVEARIECLRAVEILRFFASQAWRPVGEHYGSARAGSWLFTRRRPVGVVALITPWNFPAAIPAWKLAPALLFGNTVVLKLASDAPLTGLRLIHALDDSGVPPGVMNVVLGSGSGVGTPLIEHPAVDAVSFTGSATVGQRVLELATARRAAVQLELGGQNPAIVCDDADFEAALEAVALGAFASAGQKCTATRRVFVAASICEEFVEALARRALGLKIGRPLDKSTQLGPLVNVEARDGVVAAVDRARRAGHVYGGDLPDDRLQEGAFLRAAVVTGLPLDAELACEEVFGPVVAVWPFDEVDEALELANATPYGLSAAIFTRNLDGAKAFVDRIRAGLVHVNSQTAGADVHVPFGGLGASGYGPHEQGSAAVEFYTEQQTVYLDPAGS